MNNLILYVNDGDIVHRAKDGEVPERGQELGLLDENGVTNFVIDTVSTELVESDNAPDLLLVRALVNG